MDKIKIIPANYIPGDTIMLVSQFVDKDGRLKASVALAMHGKIRSGKFDLEGIDFVRRK